MTLWSSLGSDVCTEKPDWLVEGTNTETDGQGYLRKERYIQNNVSPEGAIYTGLYYRLCTRSPPTVATAPSLRWLGRRRAVVVPLTEKTD